LSLLGFFKKTRSAARTAQGTRIYAIGDVHGRPDLMQMMFDAIERREDELAVARTQIIMIGDIVDRGPNSREALQLLFDRQRQMPNLMTLLGNHEEMLLRSLRGDEAELRGWMTVGGAETVQSFGLEPLKPGEDALPFVLALQKAVPRDWVDWMNAWPLMYQSGDYFFCHAGIKPGVPLTRQHRRDLLWAREGFMDDERWHGGVVVHGHTITETVEIRSNRIGLDTGAYRSGVLSAACFDGTDVDILTVRSEGS
jgi:serine/threonine protein phosphatase 1